MAESGATPRLRAIGAREPHPGAPLLPSICFPLNKPFLETESQAEWGGNPQQKSREPHGCALDEDAGPVGRSAIPASGGAGLGAPVMLELPTCSAV